MIRVSSADEDKRIEITLRLRRYRSKVAEYQACKELYDSLFPSCVQHLTDMPVYRSDVFEPERWAIRRESQAERMQKSLDGMRDAYEDIERLIEIVDGDFHTVLLRRYMLNESYETIATKMNYCERQIRRIHERSIEELIRRQTGE